MADSSAWTYARSVLDSVVRRVYDSDDAMRGTNCLEAWCAAATHLLNRPGKADLNLVVSIANLPTAADEVWLRRFDPRRVRDDADSARDVADTIFPAKTWSNSSDRPGFTYATSGPHGEVTTGIPPHGGPTSAV